MDNIYTTTIKVKALPRSETLQKHYVSDVSSTMSPFAGTGGGGSWLDKFFEYDEINKILLLSNPDGEGAIQFGNEEGDIIAYTDVTGTIPSFWDGLPIATTTILGGIKVGANLSITAEGILSADAAPVNPGYWTQTGSDIYYNTGNVGIGTTTPNARLNIIGLDSSTVSTMQGGSGTGVSFGLRILAGTNSSDYAMKVTSYSGAEYFKVQGDGNVGIGTSSPAAKLEIHSDSFFIKFQETDGDTDKKRYSMAATVSSFQLSARNDADAFIRNLVTFKHDGNVGIGTDSPSSLLDVAGILTLSNAGNSATPPTIRLVNDQFSTRAAIAFSTSAATDMLFLGYTGNVGIGTSSPDARIKVQATDNTVFANAQAYGTNTLARVNNYSNVTNSAAYFDIAAGANYSSVTRLASINVGGITSTDTRFALMVRNVNNSFYERLSVLGNGKVGIGTISPRVRLELDGVLNTPDLTVPVTKGTFIVGDGGNVGMVMGTYGSPYNSYIQARNFGTASLAYNLLLQPLGGKVGIGTISPTAPLEVSGIIKVKTDVNEARIQIGTSTTGISCGVGGKRWAVDGLGTGGGYSAYIAYDTYYEDSDDLWHAIRTTLGRKMILEMGYHINGFKWYNKVAAASTWKTSDMSQLMYLSGSGNLTVLGEVTAFSTSSKKLKTNIKPLINGLKTINKLKPIIFNWNDKAIELNDAKNKNDSEAGLIAEEVEEVIPSIVGTLYDEYKGIKYDKLTPYLVDAIQELTERVKYLEHALRDYEK